MDKGNIQHIVYFNSLDNKRSNKHLAELTVFLDMCAAALNNF